MGRKQSFNNLPLPIPNNDDDSIWIFAYGSLIWQPGFKFERALKAKVFDYHRSFCVWSTTYRGTIDMPGLVMGLDRGGYCTGKAFKISEENLESSLLYLYEREMDTNAYIPSICPISIYNDKNTEEKMVEALTFVVDKKSDCYASHLSVDEKARIIKRSRGYKGTNSDYVINTYEHLRDMDIEDSYLKTIVELL